MSRWRWASGIGIVAVLAVVFVLVALGPEPTPSTVPSTTAVEVVTTTSEAPTTTVVDVSTTSTTTAEQRLAEVEELLQNLWFGWFDAIYRKDPDALWAVVATTRNYNAGVSAMETMQFTAAPSREGVSINEVNILLDRPDCLVVEHTVDATRFLGVEVTTVEVMWPDPRYGWRQATSWKFANDLWMQDCDNLEREATP
ncbi:MAG: hypothetical protein ACT4OP_12745 [Actinomycetota bacterium]